jgi:hypothetical protein
MSNNTGKASQQSDLRPGKNGVLSAPTHVPMVGSPPHMLPCKHELHLRFNLGLIQL